jgi:homogentisate 1,2-dioxygenase
MPFYHRLGEIPRKRHQVMQKRGGGMHFEHLMGNKGFVGPSSLLYHLHYPTEVHALRGLGDRRLVAIDERALRPRHLRTSKLPRGGSMVLDRVGLLFNGDCAIYHSQPGQHDEFFYRNGQADELVYVATGEGTLHSQMGKLDVRAGDYVVVPRGIVHQWQFRGEAPRLLITEMQGYVRTPDRYRNEFGQLIEGAPYSERDFRRPTELEVHDEKGAYPVVTKKDDHLTEFVLDHHPFDVVGWDGYYYPFAFSIHDFEPKVAAFHLPPPVHQTFESDGVVVCSFCPRPFDFGEGAVPAPYFHSNVWSDEVLYYASAEFMSRKGIEFGSITLHPDGLPHGPQPGRMEASVGVKWTDELAVMIDTFRPLRVAAPATEIEDREYWASWRSDR